MEKRKYIVHINFNTHKYTEARLTWEWIDDRIEKFMKYALSSLKNQTNQDFEVYVLYDPVTEELVIKALIKYEALPENIRFVTPADCKKLMTESMKDFEYLYFIRLDSDNMYHKTYIQQLHDYKPKEETQILINADGYLYNCDENILATYYNTSLSFYTFIYKVADYLKGVRYKIPGGDETKLPHEIFKRPNYIFMIHSTNYLTTTNLFKTKKVGRLITDKNEVKAILEEFI